MASIDGTPWRDAIAQALEANKIAGRKPDSLRGLAAALVALDETTQKVETWQRTLKKVRAGEPVTEATARLIAKALGVPRKRLPPPQSGQALARVERHLEAIEDAVLEVLRNQRDELELLRGLRDSGAHLPPAARERTDP